MITQENDLVRFFASLALICSLGACAKGERQPDQAEKNGPGQQPAKRAGVQEVSKKPPARPAEPEKPAADERQAAERDAQTAAPATPGPGPEEQARELLDAWLLAQNRRKFGEYAGLYAEKMAGVTQPGPNPRILDREQWLKERRRAFGRRGQITADRVRIRIAGNAAAIWFHQDSSSRGREDRGPRRLVAVREGDGLRIASEAVLPADLAAEQGDGAVDRRRFMYAVHADRTYLVLSDRPGDRDAPGDPRLLARGEVFAAGKPIGAGALPEPLGRLLGETVQLYTDGGVACRGKLGEPLLLRRVVPHFSMRAFWNGERQDGSRGRGQPAEAVARDVWELGWSGTLLVAAVSDGAVSCERALWGRIADRKNPDIFLGTVADRGAKKTVAEKVRALRAYRSLPKILRDADTRERPADEELPGEPEPDMRIWRSGKRTLYSISAPAGGACGRFCRAPWVLYEMMGGAWLMLTDRRRPVEVRPLAMMDVDGDRRIEVVAAPALYDATEAARLWRQRADLVFEQVDSIEAAYLDCGGCSVTRTAVTE